MESKPPQPSRKTLHTAEVAIQRMKTRRMQRSPTVAVNFRAESFLWKKFISLDGEYPLYTTVVLICMSLALLIWFFERGILEGRDDEYFNLDELGVAGTRLLRSLFLVLGAFLNGLLAFLLLGLNIRDLRTMPESVSIRWLFLSVFGLIMANTAALGILHSAEKSYEWRRDEDSYEKPFPHYMLLSVYVFFMAIMDILYIRSVYLPFSESRAEGWEFVRRNIPAIIELGRRERGETTFMENVSYLVSKNFTNVVKGVNVCLYFVFHACEAVAQWAIGVYQDENSFFCLKVVSRWISTLCLLPFRLLRASPLVQLPLWLSLHLSKISRRLLHFVFRPVISFAREARIEGRKPDAGWRLRMFKGFLVFLEKFSSIFSQFKPEVQRAANELWEDIKEDSEYKHSSWLKAAVITASVLLLYFGLQMVNQFRGYMDDVYLPTRNCITHNPGVSNFFLRFIGFSPSNSTVEDETHDPYDQVCSISQGGNTTSPESQAQVLLANITGGEETEAIQNPYLEFSRQLQARVVQNLEEDRLYKCEERRRADNVCVLLSAVNLAEETAGGDQRDDPSDEFFSSFTGEFVYVFDVYMRNLDWAVWVGFIVGLVFGFWTLLSVMAQYKRLSLAIRSGLFQDFEMEKRDQIASKSQKIGFLKRVDSIIDTRSFANLISQYPMSVSIFFSGMLISTAILQLVVFGALVASVVSLIASLSDSEVLSIVSPLLWMLLAFIITWLVNGPIATMVIGEGLLVSRFQVIHEILFFLFLLVFTSVHLVIGIFLAFFRMLWVLLTALMTINRLDKNLFTIYRDRDLGHKSFMALVFMQHVFHVNRTGTERQRSLWEDVLRQLDTAATRDTLRDRLRQPVAREISLPVRFLGPEESDRVLMNEMENAELGKSQFQESRRSLRPWHTLRPERPDESRDSDSDSKPLRYNSR